MSESIVPPSETSKHRHLCLEYCKGNGVDLGSSGDPVVPWAIQVELPAEQYKIYNVTRPVVESIQWRGSALDLPFKDHTLDFVHSSHLLEDFADWGPPLREWDRVLKPGGHMIIAVPDHQRFRAAVARGQGDNLSHKHESHVGELTKYLRTYEVLHDAFVTDHPHEYSILYVGRKR
jgi:SAM-dependent methyltransferase